ncbi:MAG: hypothetical protein AAF170_14625 [Bacteroidota bacterium]
MSEPARTQALTRRGDLALVEKPVLVASPKAGTIALTTLDEVVRIAGAFAKSGMFPDVRTAQQAVVKILAGREMGFPPIASMNGVHVVKGKATLGATLIAAAIKQHPRYDFRVAEISDQRVQIDFFERQPDGSLEKIGESVFTAADAKRAGTQNMGKFPRNMLHARALTNGCRWFCPDVFGGPVYTPDEMGAATDEEGVPVGEATSPSPARASGDDRRIGFPGEELYVGPGQDVAESDAGVVEEAEVIEPAPVESPPSDSLRQPKAGTESASPDELEALCAERIELVSDASKETLNAWFEEAIASWPSHLKNRLCSEILAEAKRRKS